MQNHNENFTSVIQSIHNQCKLAEELYVIVRATEKKNNIQNGTSKLLVVMSQQKQHTQKGQTDVHVRITRSTDLPIALKQPICLQPILKLGRSMTCHWKDAIPIAVTLTMKQAGKKVSTLL